jgi:hypothetical protein
MKRNENNKIRRRKKNPKTLFSPLFSFSLSLALLSCLGAAKWAERKEEMQRLKKKKEKNHQMLCFLSSADVQFLSTSRSAILSLSTDCYYTTTTHFFSISVCLSVSSRKPVIYIIECIHFYTKKLWWWIDCWDFCSTCVCAYNNGSESQKKIQEHLKMSFVTFSFFHYFHDLFFL